MIHIFALGIGILLLIQTSTGCDFEFSHESGTILGQPGYVVFCFQQNSTSHYTYLTIWFDSFDVEDGRVMIYNENKSNPIATIRGQPTLPVFQMTTKSTVESDLGRTDKWSLTYQFHTKEPPLTSSGPTWYSDVLEDGSKTTMPSILDGSGYGDISVEWVINYFYPKEALIPSFRIISLPQDTDGVFSLYSGLSASKLLGVLLANDTASNTSHITVDPTDHPILLAKFTTHKPLFDWTEFQVQIDQKARPSPEHDHPKLPKKVVQGLIIGAVAVSLLLTAGFIYLCKRGGKPGEYEQLPAEEIGFQPFNDDDF